MKKYCIARLATDDNIKRSMRFACWIIKALYTYAQYVTLTAFRKSASVLRYTYISCLVIYGDRSKNSHLARFLRFDTWILFTPSQKLTLIYMEEETTNKFSVLNNLTHFA